MRRRTFDEGLGNFGKTVTPFEDMNRNLRIRHTQGTVACKVPHGHYCFSPRGKLFQTRAVTDGEFFSILNVLRSMEQKKIADEASVRVGDARVVGIR